MAATTNMKIIWIISCIICLDFCWLIECEERRQPLRFDGKAGEFRILQVADMHYADGEKTPCKDVFPQQMASCSDLNTTAFIRRLILAEKPDLIVFTGDNIYGFDASNPEISMKAAFSPAIISNIPWTAVLGNHDQESVFSREDVMKYIVTMKNTVSQLNPPDAHTIDGFGNYNLKVHGVKDTALVNKSLINLYFLDSGDYSTVPSIPGYGWIKPSQQLWFQQTSLKLKRSYMKKPEPQKTPAPGLVYFHIPLPEYATFDSSNFTGVKQEGISSASINSGFFTTMVEVGDVKAAFTGHDHLNDFCGELMGIHLCYAGGFGYHAYGEAGWARRARMVVASLEKTEKGVWGAVKSIKTWKRLDDEQLTAIDIQVLWNKGSSDANGIWGRSFHIFGASGALPRRWADLILIKWYFGGNKKQKKELWKLIIMATTWVLWTERNQRIFDNLERSLDDIWDCIIYYTGLWARAARTFSDFENFLFRLDPFSLLCNVVPTSF